MKLIYSLAGLIVFIVGFNAGLLFSYYKTHEQCNKVGGFYIGSPYACIYKGE